MVSGQFLRFADCAYRLSCQRFQVASGEIFFAELDVVDAGAGGFGDFFEEAATAGGFVGCEGGAVGDVVEKAAGWHFGLQFNRRRPAERAKQIPRLPSLSLRLRSE